MCLSTYTDQFSEFRTKKHMPTDISSPHPRPTPFRWFSCCLLLLYSFVQFFFSLVVLFCFLLPYYQVRGNEYHLRFQILGLGVSALPFIAEGKSFNLLEAQLSYFLFLNNNKNTRPTSLAEYVKKLCSFLSPS